MKEWLSTGEMIDRLKVGEVAECINANSEVFSISNQVRKIESGSVVWNCGHLNNRAYLAGDVVNAKWRILPKYVSFEEAMKALKEGKKVYCEYRNDVCATKKQEIDIRHGGFLPIHAEAIRDGKWTIEDDSDG